MWNHPEPGTEPISLTLAGRFLSTVPPGKSLPLHLSWSPPYASLPLPDFNLYPFTVINCNHEHKNSVCSVSSHNELSNLRVGTVPSELGSWCRGEDSLYTAPSLHSFTSKDQQLREEKRWKLNFSLVTNCILPPPSAPSLPPAGPALVPTGPRSPVTNEEVEMTEEHLPSWSSKDFTHESREDNGTPLQYSCLENPRDRGAWWAAVCGVAQSRTQLKRLSSSSSSIHESS